jgi:poly(3-hydroxyoctanoate) depolymerase
MPSKLIFLPGASGNTGFWHPVAALLTHPAQQVFIGWPGIGTTPPENGVTGIHDFVARTVAEIDQPTALIAQSMGGVVAILAARHRPRFVTHLVLAALSGGIETAGLGALDWRPPKNEITTGLQYAFASYCENLEAELQESDAKTLLLWGESDPVSPVTVGRRVASLCNRSEFHVIQGGAHTFASTRAHLVAPLIDKHLSLAA